MFISDTHLPQLLSADDYTSEAQLERERAALFQPSWHLVGTAADLPRDGDYLTIDVLGWPLIVWRNGGRFQTFLNVCPHRFSRVTSAACGHAAERLRCQYHGWEFDETGNTRKIPDARSFRPMAAGELGLHAFATQTCGQLIFARLTSAGPTLEEFLGPGFTIGEQLCGPDRRLAATLDYEIATNWKCKVENSLESYHVDMVHPATFKRTPEADECFHELAGGWTTYATLQPPQSRIDAVLDRLSHRLARAEIDPEFKHYHYYPHVMFGKMRLFTWIESTLPLAPGRTRVVGKFFCYAGRSRGLRSRLLARVLAGWQRKFFTKLAAEDCGVLTEVYQGLSAARQPSTGLISVREERIFHFQKYVQQATQRAAANVNGAPDGSGPCEPGPCRSADELTDAPAA
jgi:choline monooxygenase